MYTFVEQARASAGLVLMNPDFGCEYLEKVQRKLNKSTGFENRPLHIAVIGHGVLLSASLESPQVYPCKEYVQWGGESLRRGSKHLKVSDSNNETL